jgi:hypothetical protein
MPKRLLIRIILLTFLLQPLYTNAQLKEGHYFQVIAGDEAIEQHTLWYKQGAKKQSFSATLTMRSRDYEYDAGETIVFFGVRIDADGQPIPEAIATVPSEASRLLLRFTKLTTPDDRGLTYNVYVIADDAQRFPFGSFHFINDSTKDAVVNLGDAKFLLEAGAIKNIKVDPNEQGGILINMVAHNPEDMAWSPFYSNRWGHRDNLRTLVFIIDNPQGGVTTLRYRQFEPTK